MKFFGLKLRPDSLFGRTLLTTGLTLLAFFLISTTASIYFVVIPMMKRSAEDLAGDIATAADALQQINPSAKADLREQLMHDHGIVVVDQVAVPSAVPKDTPFLPYFLEALKKHSKLDFALTGAESGPLVWVDIQGDERSYRLGFNRDRLGINAPLALVMSIGGGALLTFFASAFEVRRITGHVTKLSAATRDLGHGRAPMPVPVGGPAEIAELAKSFNQMSANLRQMAESRNVMIAGLSHDLRTPLTRLGLAAEMLDEENNSELVARIRRNLDAMNNLIGQFLLLSRGIETSNPVKLQLRAVVESLLDDFNAEGVELRVKKCATPLTYVADREVLERVLLNLIKNAVQYGQGAPVDINLKCDERGGTIEVMDRGPGIPADQLDTAFLPFHRLESGRRIRAEGSGLGLAIARQLANRHNWTIELLPREGGGTISRITLPPA